jgi:hypothetical protein
LKEVASYQQWERILKTEEATVAVFVGGWDKTRCWRGRLSPSGTRISCIDFGLNIHSATTRFSTISRNDSRSEGGGAF